MPEASGDMIVNHAGCLHESIANGAAHKLESAFAQILAHRIAFR